MVRVTIDDLATRLGLSRAAVSYALNGQPGVSAPTRDRVVALATELGWQPTVSARSLSRSRADALGLVLASPTSDTGGEPYYLSLLAGIEAEASEVGVSLLLRFVNADSGDDRDVYRRWAAERRVDGVLMVNVRIGDDRPQLFQSLNLPYFPVGGRVGTSPNDDDFPVEEAALLVEHLAERGHRSIAHLSGPHAYLHEIDRSTAVLAEAARLGLRAVTLEGDYSFESGRAGTAALLAGDAPPTAILYSNDLMALGGSIEVRGTAPGIGVASWDDSVLCRTAVPTITALDRDPYVTGRRATQKLLERIGTPPARIEAAPHPRLVVRDSTTQAAPPQH